MIAISINTNDDGMWAYIQSRASSQAGTYDTQAVMVNTANLAGSVTMPTTDSFKYGPDES